MRALRTSYGIWPDDGSDEFASAWEGLPDDRTNYDPTPGDVVIPRREQRMTRPRAHPVGGCDDCKHLLPGSKHHPEPIMKDSDPVHHPAHYNAYPGVEVIQLTKHMNFCRGNAVKYLCRAAFKGSEMEDLKKAQEYIRIEIERMESARDTSAVVSEDTVE